MFDKKPETNQHSELDTQVNHDLSVHNMPSLEQLSGASFHPKNHSTTVGFEPKIRSSSSQKKSRTMGIIIIGGGLIFIVLLVYFSYLFIIEPAVHTSQNNRSVVTKAVNHPTLQTAGIVSSSSTQTRATTSLATSSNSIKSLVNKKIVKTTVVDVPITKTQSGTSTLLINKLPPLLDSDHDGLNNLEELVLGTSVTSSDTNHNGYSDLTEVENNYNPIGTGRLKADLNLNTYHSQTFNYQILYPRAWPHQSINNGASIIFTAPNNSLIQVSVQADSSGVDILDWYQALFPKVKVDSSNIKKTADWSGIMGTNKLNFYLVNKKQTQIFVISYIPVVAERLVYPNIFQLMINSLVIK